MAQRSKKIRVGMINTNYVKIDRFTKKGTEIFTYNLISQLAKANKKEVRLTSYCSGNSHLPVPIKSIIYRPATEDKQIGETYHHLFELALISKAFADYKDYDLYHVNLGLGEYILPFARSVRKPIIITMHGSTFEPYAQKLYSLFQGLKNVYFVSISNRQRKPLPHLNYIRTVYNGIDTDKFTFNPDGDRRIIWTGRAVPEKGMDVVLQVARKLKKTAKIFPIIKEEYISWLHEEIIKKRDTINQIVKVDIDFNVTQSNLVKEYQNSKLFLFPLRWEEPFGLTLIESMACGTPVVAFARGAVPEIVKDGETGYIVNPSDDDIRGNWIIKKTGFEGLCEAVEKIYSLPPEEYRQMRINCRKQVEKYFTVERMANEYISVYNEILAKKN